MPDIEEIWFWQRIVSPHMAGLATALAARGVAVTYVAEQTLSADRVTQGWAMPGVAGVRLQLRPELRAMIDEAAAAPAGAVHLCQGLRGNGSIRAVQRRLAARGLRSWAILETVDDEGIQWLAKWLLYRHLAASWRPHLEGVIAIGHDTPRWLVARGMPPERTFPFAYFLPAVPFSNPSPQRNETSLRILFVGRLIARKRVELLLQALHCLGDPPVTLTVVGEGPTKQTLRRMSAKLQGPSVYWLGVRPMAEVRRRMAEADCLVLPSRHDGWGVVISEALMAGTPVICSDRCGAAGVVRASGCGGVFPSGNVAALAALLRRTMDSVPWTAERRAALSRWAQCLGAEAGAVYLMSVLAHARGGGPPPVPPWEACPLRPRWTADEPRP